MKNENWGKEILEGLKNKVNEIKEDASRDLEIMFSDTKEVMAIWKWTKRLSLIGIGVLITSTFTVTTGEYNIMKKELTQKINNSEEDLQKYYKENRELKDENIELNKQVEIAQAYLELDDTEKEIVDIKIDEVNKATEEQLAQEKAQKEAEEAAEKQAEEEAKRKAEEEEKARKEEEERQKAEEEAKKQEEQRKATEYANVVKTARNYLDFMAFSRKGLIDQLVYEGYSQESAEYAVDNIGADWNQQCAKKAKDYLDYMSFSRDGLYQQLAYEGFTDEQIQYGLSQVGY